jgi:hypothetical protein
VIVSIPDPGGFDDEEIVGVINIGFNGFPLPSADAPTSPVTTAW